MLCPSTRMTRSNWKHTLLRPVWIIFCSIFSRPINTSFHFTPISSTFEAKSLHLYTPLYLTATDRVVRALFLESRSKTAQFWVVGLATRRVLLSLSSLPQARRCYRPRVRALHLAEWSSTADDHTSLFQLERYHSHNSRIDKMPPICHITWKSLLWPEQFVSNGSLICWGGWTGF